jgi:hypothetical protein
MTEETNVERNEKWTDRYGKTHNKRRRDRYKSDPSYRERVKKNAREYKRKRNQYRDYNGKEYRVFRAGDIKNSLGITQSQYLWMQDRGVLPDSVFDGKQYRVSAGQFALIQQLWEKHSGDYETLKEKLHANWMSSL